MSAKLPFTMVTPAETFDPKLQVGTLSSWISTAAVVNELKPTVSVSLREGKSNGVKRKVVVKCIRPYRPAAIDGITQSVKTIEIIVTANVPVDAPDAEITNARYMVRSLVDTSVTSQVKDVIQDGSFPY
jgi:hypothetical protein